MWKSTKYRDGSAKAEAASGAESSVKTEAPTAADSAASAPVAKSEPSTTATGPDGGACVVCAVGYRAKPV